jgi:hypothetical protein
MEPDPPAQSLYAGRKVRALTIGRVRAISMHERGSMSLYSRCSVRGSGCGARHLIGSRLRNRAAQVGTAVF